MNIDYRPNDQLNYRQELRDFLPHRIFDTHVHLFSRSCLTRGARFPDKSCYRKFGYEFTLPQFLGWTRMLLPEQEIYVNSFGHPSYDSDLDASADYTGEISDNERFFGMALLSPRDSLETLKQRVGKNRLVGFKPYLWFVENKPVDEITINDMLPAEQMEYINQRGLAITLHIPRRDRLADPVNQKQMVELCQNYPRAKIIFAHIGRAYYLAGVTGFLTGIADCPNAYIDTAMVNHEGVLEYAFRNFPRQRILFGSDAPIALLRGKSVEINNQYAYLTGEDYHIGTSIYDSEKAVDFTFFYYEQLRGIKLAAVRAGLTRKEIEDIFFLNAYRLFSNT